MLYVKKGHNGDMYFVRQKTPKHEDKIVKVFYSERDAQMYVDMNKKIGER